MKNILWIALAFACGAVVSPALGDEQVETVLEGLNNPCGIAIQPETGVIFVSDSGASQIIRIVDGKAEAVITDFPKDVYGKGPKYDIGPLGLIFLDKNTLVVGGGGLPDGEEKLRVYEVPEAGKEAIKADAMKASFMLAPEPAGDDKEEVRGEGNFYGVAATDSAIYVTANGDDTKGWVGKANRKGTEVSDFTRSIATKEATEVDAPVGVTISPRGEVVIGQMGEITVPGDSLLTFYEAETGKMLLNIETGLSDITDLAYSPKGRLYALDFNWGDTSKGGIFRLDSVDGDKAKCKPVKMAGLDKPTALVFGKDGEVYITVIGTGKEEGSTAGKVVKIAPGL